MPNQPPVKTPLSAPTPATGTGSPAAEPPAPPDPQVAALLRLLRPVAEPRLHPQADARLPQASGVEVSLEAHRLRVLEGDTVLVESPLATGRALSPTPEGRFTVAAKPPIPSSLRYGHYRTRAGVLLLRGVFPGIDPLPPEAVFDQIVPKGLIQLSGEGPMIFGGEATGAATSDGTLVLPDRIAVLLHEKLPLGVPVVIAR